MHYYAIIIILDETGLRSTILSFIAIISWTIYRPAKFVIVTGLALHSSYDQWDPCGEGELLQVPRCKHLRT